MANVFTSDTNCKALWRFENGALTTDTIGTNTLTTSGSPASDTADYKEGAGCVDLELSESDYLYITNTNLNAGFPLKSDDSTKIISVTAWVKPESVTANGYIFAKYNPVAGGRSFGVYVNSDSTVAIIIGHTGGGSFERYFTTATLTTGRWYHIGVTFNDSDGAYRIRVWDDTAQAILEDKAANFTNKIYLNTQPVHIGANSAPNEYFDGKIDEVAVFNDVLTPAEIDQIRSGVYGPTPFSYTGDGVYSFAADTVVSHVSSTAYDYVGVGVFSYASAVSTSKAKAYSCGGAQALASGTVATSDLVTLWTHVGTDATAVIAAGTGTQDITLPGPPQRGDLVIVAVSGDVSCADSITTDGYATVENGTGANPGAYSAYKVMGLTPDTVVAITQDSSKLKSAVVQVYRGGNVNSILDVSTAAATGSSANPQSNVIATGTDNALVVVIAHLDDDDATVSAWPTGYDTWATSANTGQSSTAIGSTTAMCARVVSTAGTETPSAFTMSSADQWQAVAVSFKIAGTATTHEYVGDGCMVLSSASETAPRTSAFEYDGNAAYAHAAGTVVSATPFDHMRRAILNAIVSAQDEATGWNALKGTIPLSAVVRTDDNTVTITLPALATYDITAAETLTVNVPAGATDAGDAIVGTPTVTIQTGGVHDYTGSGAMAFRSGAAYSADTVNMYVYTGNGTQVYSSATVATEGVWSDWSEVGTFTTAGIDVGGGLAYSCGSTYEKGIKRRAYVGQGVIAYANGTERSVGKVYVGDGAYHFQSGTVVANTVSVAYNYVGAGAIVHIVGSLYEADLAETFPSAESYIGGGAFSFQSAYQRVRGRAWTSPNAAYCFRGGTTAAEVEFYDSEPDDLEPVPAVRTASLEDVPTLSTGQYGAWTESDEGVEWTEEAVRGTYTDVGYTKEYEPINRPSATKEDIPL